jgi:hypothetical protein
MGSPGLHPPHKAHQLGPEARVRDGLLHSFQFGDRAAGTATQVRIVAAPKGTDDWGRRKGEEMARYGQASEDRVVARLLPRESASVEGLARAVGVGAHTLERRRSDALSHPARERVWTAPTGSLGDPPSNVGIAVVAVPAPIVILLRSCRLPSAHHRGQAHSNTYLPNSISSLNFPLTLSTRSSS